MCLRCYSFTPPYPLLAHLAKPAGRWSPIPHSDPSRLTCQCDMCDTRREPIKEVVPWPAQPLREGWGGIGYIASCAGLNPSLKRHHRCVCRCVCVFFSGGKGGAVRG